MGTTWSLRMDNRAMLAGETVRAAIERALDRVVAQMSTWDAASDICRFNGAPAGSTHVVPPEFAQVLACALQWAAASGGALDPTIGRLVALWGFGAQAHVSEGAPDPAALAQARAAAGWQRLAFDAATRTLVQPGGLWLDFSGIAKGYAVDQAAAALEALGLTDFLIEVGGELRGRGRRPGGLPWQVQVDTGGDGNTLVRCALDNAAIATSGDRWHVREIDGQRLAHTIDPRSGAPVRHALAAVTVRHAHCMQADALATVLTVLGPDDGLAFADTHGIAALFACRSGDGGDEPVQLRHSRAWADTTP